jgi:nitroreductase
MDALEALLTRRSAGILVEPAPDDETLATMLRAGMRAADHGRLQPWRFIVLRGQARERLGEIMVEAARRREPDAPPAALKREHDKPLRAPLILVVAAEIAESHKIPVIEQVLAAGAAAQNILVAAFALGYGAMWRTGAPAYDPHVKEALGLKRADAIVGFLYIGTPSTPLASASPPTIDGFVRSWPLT